MRVAQQAEVEFALLTEERPTRCQTPLLILGARILRRCDSSWNELACEVANLGDALWIHVAA